MSMNAPLSPDDIIQTGLQTAFAAISGARSSNPANLEYIGLKVQAAIDALQVVEAKVKARALATAQAEEAMGPRHEEMLRRTLGGMKLSGELERKVPRYEPGAYHHSLPTEYNIRPEPWMRDAVYRAVIEHVEFFYPRPHINRDNIKTTLLVLERLGLIPKFPG